MVLGKTVADLLVEKLSKWGVKRVYGIPGDAINTIMDAIRRSGSMEFILVRHEESGAFAASAESKLSGGLSACVGTSGPGAIHLLNGLYEAKTARTPVIALTGQVDSDLIGTDYFQEVDILRLFSDVTVYNQRIASAADAAVVIETACREAVTRRGVSHISFPLDLPRREVPAGSKETEVDYQRFVSVPAAQDLKKAADMLNDSSRIAILAGGGARGAREELTTLSDVLGATITTTLPGKGAVPDSHPNSLGGLGFIGTRPSQDAMEEADALLMIGSNYPYSQFLPKDAKVIQIDINPEQIGKRIPVDVGLFGDARMTIRQLLPLLQKKQDLRFLEKYRQKMAAWKKKLDDECLDKAVPIRPQLAARALQEVMPEDAIICVDVGNVTVWLARYFNATNQKFVFSQWLGSMAVGFPSAIGAKMSHPDKSVAAFVGDGGFTMLMGDFTTAVKYNLPILTVVINNGILGMIKFEQEIMGHPEFGIDFHNPNFAEFAEACGGLGIRVTDPGQLKKAMEQARDSGKPAIVEVMAERNERPMPPKIKPSTAVHYATALFREKFDL